MINHKNKTYIFPFNYSSSPYPPGFYQQGTQFDFFNYAGIHRSVVLYSTPKIFIDDVSIVTGIDKSNKTGNKF